MSKIVSFLIKMSANASNTIAVAQRIQRQLDQVDRKSRNVGKSLRQAFDFSSFNSSLMSIPGMQFLLNPYTMIGAGIGAITKLGAEAEMTATAFTTLVGEESKAKAMLEEIRDFADSTPFDKLHLTESSKTMMSLGIASDKALTYMRQLGDISGGSAEKLHYLSIALGQVTATTYLQGQDLNQFINAGFNPLKELAEMTGKSYRELKEYMSQGRITAENVAQAIAHATAEGGRYHGMLDATSKTISGRWSTAMGSVRKMAEQLFEYLKPMLFNFFDLFEAILPPIMQALTFVFKVIAGGIGWIVKWREELLLAAGVIAVIIAVVKANAIASAAYLLVVNGIIIALRAWTIAQAAFQAVMHLSTIGAVVVVITALIAAVVYCWHKFAGFRAFLLTMWDTVKGFGSIIKDYVISRIKELLGAVGDVAKAFKLLFAGDFTGAANAIGSAAKKFSGVGSSTTAYQSAKGLLSGVSNNYQSHLKQESRKQAERDKPTSKNKITKPQLAGSDIGEVVFGAGKPSKRKKRGENSKTANAIATGGQRNTSINMTIGKFFDEINVHMMDKTDTSELQRIVLETLNRALAIATSTDR